MVGFQQAHTGFQGGHTGFQQDFFSGGSGGSGASTKIDPEAFEAAYSRFKRENEKEIDVIPEKVIRAIKKVAKQDDSNRERELQLREEVAELELKWRRKWLQIATELHEKAIEEELKMAFHHERELQRQEDDEAIMLLLM